ncbi:MAG TPA: plastocyanin/azurin family copper-binding protein [Egibacteraceae bacterium]|nr:plastocyanin/azurin family copper-binding protein [Egibacteraceae bacterium]
MTPPRFLAALTALALLSACGGASNDPAAAPANAPATASGGTPANVQVRNIAYQPAEITVLRGTAVTWINDDEEVRHTVTSGTPGQRAVPGVQEAAEPEVDGLFDGDLPDAGDRFSYTFAEAGSFPYFCEVHPSMTATVVVE